MPVVRRYERSVGSTGLPNARKSAAATPDSEGAGLQRAKADTQMAIARVGEQVIDTTARLLQIDQARRREIEEKERDGALKTKLLETNNAIANWKATNLYDPEAGAFARKGKNALGLPEELQENYLKLTGDLGATLTTPEQREAFARQSSSEWNEINLSVRRHVFTEQQAYAVDELKTTRVNAINEAIQGALDPRSVAVALTKATTAVAANGPRLGMSPAVVEAEQRADRTEIHVGVIKTLLAKEQDQKAADYYAAVSDQIDGKVKDDVIAALDAGSSRDAGIKASDRILKEGGTLKEQLAKTHELPAKAREIAEQRLRVADAEADEALREGEVAALKGAYAIVDQTGDVTKIPPDQQVALATHMPQLRAFALARAKGTPPETDQAVFYAHMQQAGDDPAAFVKVNLLKYRNKLNDSDFQQLAGLQLSLKNGDRKAANKELAPYEVQRQLLDDNLALYGLNPDAKPDTVEGRAIAQVRGMLREQGDLLQADGSKAKTEDIQAAIDKILSQRIPTSGMFGAGSKPLVEATIADVPRGFKLRNPGVSDAVLLNRWITAQSRLGGSLK